MSDVATLERAADAPTASSLSCILAMRLNDVQMPLHHDRNDCGTIVDAEGKMIVVVDMHRERPDQQVMAIAELIVLAVNSHAGFQAES
jgi:hypothetical protein